MWQIINGQAGTIPQTVDVVISDTPVGTLTSVSFEVFDEKGVSVQAAGPGGIVNAITGSIAFSILAPAVTIPATTISAIRKVRFTVAYSSGSSNILEFFFVVIQSEPLQVGINSFATFMEAALIAFELPDTSAWDLSEDRQKINAMVSARADLIRLKYRYGRDDPQTYIVDVSRLFSSRLEFMTPVEFAALPKRFLDALKKAQVIQSDYILGGGSEEERLRQSGIISKKVGEASATFQPGSMPVRYPVCNAALAALYGFLELGKWQIARR